MNITEYQLKSIRTMKIDEGTTVNCCMGLCGEVGEVVDLLKKHIFQGKELDKDKLEEELGDVMFYLVNLATNMNLSMEDILQKNVDKLIKRYPNGFNKEDAIKRMDENE